MSVTILDRHEVFYYEELLQMVDFDDTHTEESNFEQTVLCKVQLQLPENAASMLDIKRKAKCLKLFPSKLNWLPQTQSMHFVSPTSVIEGPVSCKYCLTLHDIYCL
jgi:hypothetical protein